MKGKFNPMTEKYRKKHYPDGYFAAMRKTDKSAGIGLLIMGVPFALIGAAGVCGVIWFFLKGVMDGDAGVSDIPGMLFLAAIPGVFLLIGIFCIWGGRQRKDNGIDDNIQFTVKASGYPESVIRDFDRQVTYPDTIEFELKPNVGKGILTKDYIFVSFIVIKRTDVKAAYFIEVSDKIYVGNKLKTIYNLELAIFSNHGTCASISAKRESAEHLISLLRETNPDIDTAGGRVLSEKEYEDLKREAEEFRKQSSGESLV